MFEKEGYTQLIQAEQIAQAVLQKVKNKNYAVKGTSLLDYGIEDAYTKEEIDAKMTSAYTIGGSKTASQILDGTLLIASNYGKVYNLKDELVIPANKKSMFVENAEGTYAAGQNFVVIKADESYTACGEGAVAIADVTYYELDDGEYVAVDGISAGDDVSDYYTKDPVSYVFDAQSGFTDVPDTVYEGGNGIDINNKVVSMKIDPANARGLFAGANGAGITEAVADTWGYVPATGTYQVDTLYFTDNTGTTLVDTSGFTPGVTDVSAYYVEAKTADGASGAFTGAEKAKLARINPATQSQVNDLINNLISL